MHATQCDVYGSERLVLRIVTPPQVGKCFQLEKRERPTKTSPKKFDIRACIRQIRTTRRDRQKPRHIDTKTNVLYGGDLAVPTPEQSLGSVLFNRMLRFDRREEVLQMCLTTERKMTTKLFLENSVGLAEKLAEEGTKKGDFVLLIGSNTINMNVALVGILFLGAVPVPLSHKAEFEEFQFILKTLRPVFYGCQSNYLYSLRRAFLGVGDFDISKVFLLDQEASPTEPKLQGFRDFIRGRGRDFESFRPAVVENPKGELALVMKARTDGVVGRVVGLTHHNLNSVIARYDAIDDGVNLRAEVTLMVHKVLWMSGIYPLILSCAFGSKLIVMSKFDEETFLKTLSDHKVTNTYLFSAKWWLLYKHTPKGTYDLSSCKRAYATDGSLPKVLTDRLKQKTGLIMKPCYGTTELSGMVLLQEGEPSKEGSVGKLVPQVYGKVVSDVTSQNAGPKEPGELCFKGPIVSQGYINNKKATHLLFDKDGYVLTGQYGYYDETGEFFIIDKIIHQIKYKEHKVSPKELEGIINSLDTVKDVCVTGISHATDGEHPIAFVVPQKGQKITEHDIINHVNDKVPDHKQLRGGVVFLSKIPRFRDTGLVKRKVFRKVLSKYRVKVNAEEPNVKGLKIK